jgi:steroid delta-isomerase
MGTDMTESIASRYVEAVNTQDADGLLALFAPDALLLHPVGRFEGTAEIAGLYRDIVFLGQAQATIVNHYALEGVEVALLEATSPVDPDAGTVHAADIFTLNAAGTLDRLEIYYR